MKKFINGILLILLTCFSFFYTDKVMNMINSNDPLMVEIYDLKTKYDVLPVNAYIDGDTVIPGIIGKEVNIDKSYENMKISGVFRESLLIFDDLYPNNSLMKNMDKYIVKGNGSKKEVSIIYILNINYIDKLKQIDNITVFINHKDLNVNIINLLKEKEIYTYGNDGIYSDEILTSDNSLINRITNNNSKYCLVKEKKKEILDICKKNDMFVILPSIIGNYYNIKNNLSNGSIIVLDNLNDIDVIVKYIKSKGFDIVTLDKLLSE